MEQQAGVRHFTKLTHVFALLLTLLFAILTLFTGRHRGWIAVAAVILIWGCFTLYMRRAKKGQP
ncbi:hypothetical protein [Streptomyces sp. NPDC059063]|uniref:hypothetical protein n=1 Tax=unclassified Streptomyces TaxID=2593676 RepID=UPI0036C1B98C